MKKFKRTLSLLLCLIMVACLVPTTAFAEGSEPEKYNVWVAGTQVTSTNAGNILGDGAASYDAETNTLTVKKDIVAAEEEYAAAIKTSTTLTVKIEGSVTLSSSNGYGIDLDNGSLKITGGKLVVKAERLAVTAGKNISIDCEELDLKGSFGVYTLNGSVKIIGDKITMNADENAVHSRNNVNINCKELKLNAGGTGIYSMDGAIAVSGDKVSIDGAYGINSAKKSVELKGSTPNDGNITVSAYFDAILAAGDITVQCDTLDLKSISTDSSYDPHHYSLHLKDDGKFIYPAGATVVAATEVDGTFEAYDETKNATYDHVKIGTVSEVTPITTVEIDGVSAPQLNQTREAFWNKYNTELTDGTITLNEKTYVDGKFDNIIVVDGEFYHADKETVVDDSHVIAPGTYYNALALLPAEGFEFAEDITATVDGATATETEFLENGVLVIYAKYVLEAPAPVIPTEITEVDATVAEPVVGGTPSTVATTTGTDYTVFVSGWYDEEENTVSVFEAGKTYTLEVGFTPKEGYVLAGSKTLNATINDKEAEYLSLNTINGTVTCFIRYTIPAVVPTEINISKLPSLTVGDKITKAMAKNVFPAGLTFIGNTPYVAVINGVLIGQPTKAETDTNYYLYATWDLEDYTEIPDASQFVVKYNGTALTYTPNNLVKDNEQSGYYFFEANGNIYCRVWIYLGKAAPAVQPTVIDEIKIEGLPAPQYGQTVEQYWNAYLQNESNGVLTINGEKLSEDYFGNLYFAGNDLFDGNMDSYDDTDATFTPGTYYFYLCLRPANGYTFADSLNVSVKDVESANVDVDFNDKNDLTKPVYIYVEYEVTAPAVAPTEIDEIKIEGLPAPQYGQTYSQWNDTFNNNCDTGVLKINESIGVDGWNFGDVFLDGKSLMDETMKHFYETITAGTYYVKLWLYHSEGFVFADGLSITVDGVNPANVTFEQDPDEEECKIVYVKYEITAPSSAPTEITEVDATVAEPVVGGTPSTVATTTGTDYTVFVSGWYDEEENTVSVFEAGKTYTLEVGFTPKEGYVLAGSKTLNATINDKEAEYLSLNTINGTVTCFIRYTIPAVVPAEYNITVNGGTASVGAGTAVTKAIAGTVITLTVDDSTIPAGKVFDKWEVVSGGVTVTDGKFTMPESAVEITATYKDAPVDPPFVDWIEISDVTAPVAGTDASIAPNYVVDSARNYTVEKAEWWMNDSDSKATEFVAGTNYRAVFTLVPKEGVVFDSPLKVKINGNDATVISSSEDKAVVSISLTATSAPASHTCDIKPVAKDEPSCTEGGKEAYYKCDGCGKFYEDALGAKEITDLANWGNLPKLGHTESDWKSDKDNHWKECTVTACGVIIEDSKAAHKDDNKDGKCDVCEYNVGFPTTPDEDKPNDTPQTGDNSMIWLLIALLFVSGAGVVATTVYGKKKFSVK